jgi:hypothetical protein
MENDITNYLFTQCFCHYLARHLSVSFEYQEDDQINDFWCDGIVMPSIDRQLYPKNINDTRKIVTTAWIGPIKGEDRYEMTIHFGPKALSRYARGLDLKECIPAVDTLDWIWLDTDEKKIELLLK